MRGVQLATAGGVVFTGAGDSTVDALDPSDGTVLWMADERAIAEHVAPRITKAAEAAGRPAPRVVAGIPVCLCRPQQVDEAAHRGVTPHVGSRAVGR